jgi:hypothetical protein
MPDAIGPLCLSAIVGRCSAMPTDPEIFATLEQPVSDEDVKRLASDLSDALGQDRVLDYDGRGCVIRERSKDYHLLPDPLPRVESILSARLCTPYYAPGYERGYWPGIAAALEFLRHRLPGAQVWYGPDGTEELDQANAEFMRGMWSYWAQHGTRPYYERDMNAQRGASPNSGPVERLGNSRVGGGPPSVS